MSRSAAVRSRIEAFESGKPIPIQSESPPNNSWTFVSKPHNHISPLDEPLSPTAHTVALIKPDLAPIPTPPRSRSPPILGRNSSLVDISEIASVASSTPSSVKSTSDHLINLKASPPTKNAPPVPPRTPAAVPSSYPDPPSSKLAVSEPMQDKDLSSRISLNHKLSSASLRSPRKPPLPPRRSDTGVNDKIPNNMSVPQKLNLQDRNWTGSSTSTSSWQHVSPLSQNKPESRLISGLMLPRPGHAHVNSTSSFQSVSLSDGGSETTDSKDTPFETPSRPVAEIVTALSGMNDSPSPVSPSIVVPYAPRLPRRRGTQVTTPVPVPRSSPSSTSTVLPAPKPKPTPPPPLTGSKALAPGYSFPVQLPSFSIRRLAPPSLPSGSFTNTLAPDSKSSSPHGIPYSPLPPSSSKPASIKSDRSGSRTSLNVGSVPGANRKRYEALFERNLAALRQLGKHKDSPSSRPSSSSSRSSGWRSVSASIDERLPGTVIKRIWLCSKLERSFMRGLWAELDKESTGSLDRESFIQGMWRMDSELSKSAESRKSVRY